MESAVQLPARGGTMDVRAPYAEVGMNTKNKQFYYLVLIVGSSLFENLRFEYLRAKFVGSKICHVISVSDPDPECEEKQTFFSNSTYFF